MDWKFKHVFHVIVIVTTLFEPTTMDCLRENYTVNNVTFAWPETTSNDVYIASDCIDENKILMYRHCLNNEWIPNIDDLEKQCKYINEEITTCPRNSTPLQIQGSFPRTICIHKQTATPAETECIYSSHLFMELTSDEQMQLMAGLKEYAIDANEFTFSLGARNRWPNKVISKYYNDENAIVEFQDIRCGRFGLPIEFKNLSVYCTKDKCDKMCLTLNVTTEPSSLTVENCNEPVLLIETTFMHQFNYCPSGYYLVEYMELDPDNSYSCFSIQMFPDPIRVIDVENANVESFCNGSIMPITRYYNLFIFMQLSERIKLSEGNHCLFGIMKSNTYSIVKYSERNLTDVTIIPYWDKSMNYSLIIAEGQISYLSAKSNGQWTWAIDTVSCIVCMHKVPILTPKLLLNYNVLERKLELEVTHREFLYKEKSSDLGFICFALIGEKYKTNLTINPIAESVGKYKYAIENVGVGKYWCSGHTVGSGKFCTSDKIYAFGEVFAFQVVRECLNNSLTNCSFNNHDLSQFARYFKQKFNYLSILGNPYVINETIESDTNTFTAHLNLKLQDNVTANLLDTNLMNLTDYPIQTAFIYENLLKNLVYNKSIVRSIRSSEYCLHESALSIDSIIWHVAHNGETISTSSLCPPEKSGTEKSRTCTGDFENGLSWKQLVNASDCHTNVSESLLELYTDISYSNRTDKVIDDLQSLLERNIDSLLPIDVFLTSRILQRVSNVTLDNVMNVFLIYNTLMKIDSNYLKISASFNSTNVLLEALDNILTSSSIIRSSKYLMNGNISVSSPLIKTFILNPIISNLHGVFLLRPRDTNSPDDDFSTYSTRYIYTNETIANILVPITDNDLIIGSYLPKYLLNTFQNISIVMTVFFNDKLFQSTDKALVNRYSISNGKIISVTIHGLGHLSNLSSNIQIFFETNQTDDSICAYWDLTSISGWSSSGCELVIRFMNYFQKLVMCECSHLTHIGYLIDTTINETVKTNESTVSIITVIGASFSLFGSLGIFITAALFETWRSKFISKILINVSASTAVEMFLMILINADDELLSNILDNTLACAFLGSAFHYSALVMYFWTLIVASIQLSRYIIVTDLNVSHLVLKLTTFAWGFPLLPVITVLIVDHTLYVPLNKDESKFCYPSGFALSMGVVALMALSFCSITCLLVVVSFRRGLKNPIPETETNVGMKSLDVIKFVVLFFTLGLTWIFGLLCKINVDYHWMFSYLFCITSIIQGIVLIFCFIVFDPTVRNLWLKMIFLE